jgi:hypothetical protein
MIALLFLLLFLFSILYSFKSLKVFLCRAVAHFVPSRGTFCAFPRNILCLPVAHFVPSRCTFCAFPWHISKSIFVPCCCTFCAWYYVPSSRIASQELQVKKSKSRIACQELRVKNCKSRIAKSLLDSLYLFFSRLNE